MKQLILDYLRRWARALAVGALAELLIGWFGGHLGEGPYRLAALQGALGLFLGALLLSFDLQSGLSRMVGVLPLTGRQIGRAWWQASVLIPALVFGAAQFLGAGGYWLGHRATSFDWVALGVSDVYLFLMLGSAFPLAFLLCQVTARSGWRVYLGVVAGVVWGAAMGGSLFFFENAVQHRASVVCFLVMAAGLTAAGWHWAGPLVLFRTGLRLGTQVAPRRTEIGRAPAGYGGVSRLIGTTFVRAFLVGVAMIIIMPLVFLLVGGKAGDLWEAIHFFPSVSLFPFMFVVFFSLLPALTHLRMLRSLPISPTKLAGAFLATVILPLVGLQLVMTGLAWLVSGGEAALGTMNSFLLAVPWVALSLVFIAWLGLGNGTYLLMMGLMIAAELVPVVFKSRIDAYQHSLVFSLVISGFFLVGSFWLIRRSLLRSRRLYRSPVGFGNWAWGGR